MKSIALAKMFNKNYTTVDECIRETCKRRTSEDAFYICDVNDILRKHQVWVDALPRVRPFYAIKCNNSQMVLEILAAFGIGFDCASKAEINQVLAMGVKPSDIIYANPCKTKSFIAHAGAVGVDRMTFDNELELLKISKLHPKAKLIIRIKVDDSHSVCKFSIKFGADLNKVPMLLTLAKQLGLDVIGVSFHVGSSCESADSWDQAIAASKGVFETAKKIGYDFTFLDLGGGYPGTAQVRVPFSDIAPVINKSLDEHFPEFLPNGTKNPVEIIAEPGRYYVASAFTLITSVIAKREEINESDSLPSIKYYINDGLYGSFNCTIFDHWKVEGAPFVTEGSDLSTRPVKHSTVFGPTCDSFDLVLANQYFPEMNIGDWLIFREMGAYTIVGGSNFNGFRMPAIKYHLSGNTLAALEAMRTWQKMSNLIAQSEFEEFGDDDSLSGDSCLEDFNPELNEDTLIASIMA